MVRTYKRKTNRSSINPNVMKMAVEEVKKGQSLRKVAEAFGFNFKTLANYCKKYQQTEVPNDIQNVATATVVQRLEPEATLEVAEETADMVTPEPRVEEKRGPDAVPIPNVDVQLQTCHWSRFGYAKARSVSYKPFVI